MVVEEVYALFLSYSYLASFIAGVVSEDLLLLLAIASGSSRIDFWVLFLFGFLGVVLHDAIIYLIA